MYYRFSKCVKTGLNITYGFCFLMHYKNIIELVVHFGSTKIVGTWNQKEQNIIVFCALAARQILPWLKT